MKAKIKTWLNQIETGKVKSNSARVLIYLMMENAPVNLYVMRNELRMAHQTLTSTISVLMDYGLIKIVGDTKINNNTYSKFMFVECDYEREILQHLRKKEKFRQWLAKGIDEYTQLLPIEFNFKLQNLYFNAK